MKKNSYPGKLIVFEGVDGSGKSVQLNLLMDWLKTEGHGVLYSKRKKSKLLAQTINDAKKRRTLNYITYSLIHASDTTEQLNKEIIPALKAGFYVLVNKYTYTAFAKDTIRGNDPEWLRGLYDFAIEPDLTFYFDCDAQQSLDSLYNFGKIDFYDAGMDLGFSDRVDKSLVIFQSKLIEQFEKLKEEFNFICIDSSLPIKKQQILIRNKLKEIM